MEVAFVRTLLSSRCAPWGVLDSWLNRGRPLGVFTVLTDHAQGDSWLAKVKDDHQGAWGLAVVDQPAPEPADRLREALNQSKRRQEKRLAITAQPPQLFCAPDAARRRAAAGTRDADMAEPRNLPTEAEMRPVPRYAQDRHGQGRWVRLYRGGALVGTLWTDDAQGLGFIPEPGSSVTLLVNSIGTACALGTPTSWVFDDHAAWAAQEHWAGPVERGDLATLGSGQGSSL